MGLDLLEVRFAFLGGDLCFAGASTQPELLRLGDAAFVATRLADMVA
ncbi:MAG: hypothetical protein IT340_17085 [Chloroflexi bacterium]|nr:hypothetical protein [Chloroflexota bacterium]